MKHILTMILAGLSVPAIWAQDITDVTDLGTTDLVGTARYRALSGAFGALGGDLSALNNNPAASAVFKYSEFTFTGASYRNKNLSNYGGSFSNRTNTTYEINQVGGVLVFNNRDQNSEWNKFTLAFNYDLQNNFDNDIFILGRGSESIADYFVANANGFSPDDLSVLSGETVADAYIAIGNSLGFDAQQGFLGYQAFVIDPAGNNNQYISNATLNNGVDQEQRITTRGSDSKFTLNLGGQYNENIYFGMGLNLHAVDRRRIIRFDEFNYDQDSFVQYTQFDNELNTFGSGFSANFGVIAKVGNSLRLGGSYQTPTWYDLADELWQGINTDLLDADTGEIDLVEVYPNVIYRFPDYSIRIPSKLTASGAMVLGKSGLISVDYTYQDMSNARLRPTSDPFFAAQNTTISNELQAVSTLRMGAEFRFGKWSFRGGYRFEESPYRNAVTIGDLQGYSLGLGLDFGGSAIDLAWSTAERDSRSRLYPQGITTPALIANETNNWVVSYSVRF
ncbi:aromatic hydrocarbon degradation protein [Robertkochia sediminum]|uniref:aromatic hydrocarbon degradation protein n=1 Tax=Robertkochia sediminum TaxID=2785326 RepID=UPI0019317233|nr:aromatic hydrocarbon degradation protein [Robertkochia sediminum]MBL7472589.1 aromatic hydrocarbon degradation protein [Robertkochia sediminum]